MNGGGAARAGGGGADAPLANGLFAELRAYLRPYVSFLASGATSALDADPAFPVCRKARRDDDDARSVLYRRAAAGAVLSKGRAKPRPTGTSFPARPSRTGSRRWPRCRAPSARTGSTVAQARAAPDIRKRSRASPAIRASRAPRRKTATRGRRARSVAPTRRGGSRRGSLLSGRARRADTDRAAAGPSRRRRGARAAESNGT